MTCPGYSLLLEKALLTHDNTDQLCYIECITYTFTKTKMKEKQYNTYNLLLFEYRTILRKTIFNSMLVLQSLGQLNNS